MPAPSPAASILPSLPPATIAALPTPVYVYDLAAVRRNHDTLRTALPADTDLYYSLKANPHPDVLTALRQRGTRPEVCSSGELDAALAAGWPATEVLYTGPGKRDAEIGHALQCGVQLFSVDSPHAIEQLDRLAAALGTRARCLLRINDDQPVPGQGLAMTGVASQFGADTAWVLAEPTRFASRPHAEVTGLHLYMGTNLTDPDALLGQFARSLATARALREALAPHGVRLRTLDLGGGFGAPFARDGTAVDLSGLRPRLAALLDAELPGRAHSGPKIAFESGRYLVGTAGVLLTSVLDVKRSQDKDVVVLESGINHLGGMSGLRRLPPLAPHLVTGPATGPMLNALVTGPLCTPLDTWARAARLPALRPGDRVAVPNVGAYGLYASLIAFLGHPLPAETVIDGDHPEQPPRITRLRLHRTPERETHHSTNEQGELRWTPDSPTCSHPS
ncbi:type III PLP-dependent enzyme [Streptomyces sp. TRM 70361]|uniref:type III PLP-dependent enzyme n=1 Tax=Streptomyces sp. TRM 70361 TaxID=3116553 RepID=UPI002E7BEFEE|nr:type III PLP-dependent enzyme [Streptomyces sp. TRM 70361]MEE1943034.1 type III PLP-dependent enzyme [Streptomyces sp. TRM 70361]